MEIRCRALLFDMDGVLVDSTPAVARVWTAWAEKFGLHAADVVRQAHGRPSIETIRELLPHADHHAEDQAIEEAEIEDVADVVALPGARDILAATPPQRFAVVTSATYELAQVRLAVSGLLPYVHNLITSTDIQRGKPDPEPYLKGAAKLKFPPADCLVIEDAIAGVRSGKAAGCRVIALRTTSSDADLLAAGADWLVNDCSSLRVILQNQSLLIEL